MMISSREARSIRHLGRQWGVVVRNRFVRLGAGAVV